MSFLVLPIYFCAVLGADPAKLSVDRYLDKAKGAWAGQMVGVCYGSPYEFRSNGAPITEEIRAWTPERVNEAIDQDDCYVEMTFLKTIEQNGLDVTYEQAGKAIAETQFPLWHANRYGRENCRHGIMPPKSGQPEFNHHADDIDFQIESDLLGILCPGLPNESNRLCEIFGRIMNYGDGLYGGMFISGMYADAFFEDNDVEKVIRAGLACIPEASQYHKCISDVLAWHKESPEDWLAVWKKIEAKWQDDVDCSPGNPFNIDAKLNGAYVVMGLLYGNGDFAKTIEISTRCGQDADCNPSSAAGVVGCMKGFDKIPANFVQGIAAIADKNFSHTDYSFNTLIPACRRVTESIIKRAGGRIEADAFAIPRQTAKPPEKLEQWDDQKKTMAIAVPQHEVEWWDPKWKVLACGADMEPGYRAEYRGREHILLLHPVDREHPAIIQAQYDVPKEAAVVEPLFLIETASHERGDYLLKVFVDDVQKLEKTVDTKGAWASFDIDLDAYKGKKITVRIENWPNGWSNEAAYFGMVGVTRLGTHS